MKNTIIIFIITVFIIGAGAFYGGMLYGKSRTGNLSNLTRLERQAGFGGPTGLQGGPASRAGRGGTNFVNGDIIAKDEASITVKDQNGGSKIIFLSDSTQISKFAAASTSDLIINQNIMANGTANTDGSMTAQMIQLRPTRPSDSTSTPQP